MKISIVLRAYNSQETIARAMASAVGQEFPAAEFEVIAVNDGSGDRTAEILRDYANRSNVRIVDQEHRGAIRAANRGFYESRGQYVVLLDSDDSFAPRLVAELSAILDRDPEVHFVYSDYYESGGARLMLVRPRHLFETVAVGVMFRRAMLAAVGFYAEAMGFAEYDLLLRTLGHWNGYHHPLPLFTYYRRPHSLTGQAERVSLWLEQLKARHPDKVEYIRTIRRYE